MKVDARNAEKKIEVYPILIPDFMCKIWKFWKNSPPNKSMLGLNPPLSGTSKHKLGGQYTEGWFFLFKKKIYYSRAFASVSFGPRRKEVPRLGWSVACVGWSSLGFGFWPSGWPWHTYVHFRSVTFVVRRGGRYLPIIIWLLLTSI